MKILYFLICLTQIVLAYLLVIPKGLQAILLLSVFVIPFLYICLFFLVNNTNSKYLSALLKLNDEYKIIYESKCITFNYAKYLLENGNLFNVVIDSKHKYIYLDFYLGPLLKEPNKEDIVEE